MTENDETNNSAVPLTRGFGLGCLPLMDATAESAGFIYSSVKSSTNKNRRESVPIASQYGTDTIGKQVGPHDKLKIATA